MDLEFDKMTVDTTLAQEYLRENKDLFDLYQNYKNSTATFKPYVYEGELVIESAKDEFNLPISEEQSVIAINTIQVLASRLKHNAALIAQLEYHIRNIPIEDTNAQLNLIIQHLYCQTMAPDHTFHGLVKNPDSYRFDLLDEPLLKLQTVVHAIMHSQATELFNMYKATTVITHLFVKLCQEAGFKNIVLKFVDGDGFDTICQHMQYSDSKIKGYNSGTIAIVSEDADIDSAVDKFLAVSKQAPWRLRRILVQESIYQLFKDALSWKCNLKKQEQNPLDSNVLCCKKLTYNGKSFLIDPVQLPSDQHSMVTVESYRTCKEMMSLLQTDKARYLSLWANDIAQINEVTHNTESPVVWVNNIADFRGPPFVSAAVFSQLFEKEEIIKASEKTSKLFDLLQSWQKLDYDARRETLCNALDKYMTADPEDKINLKSAILTSTRKSFVDVGKDYVCVGIWEPVGIRSITDFKRNPLSDIFKSILNGNGYAFNPTETFKFLDSHFKVFEEVGVPLVLVGGYSSEGYLPVKHRTVSDRIRVIWTNTGTIFAN